MADAIISTADGRVKVVPFGSDVVTPLAARAEVAAATAEAAAGPTYANTTAGLAATTSGQSFAVNNGDGTVTIYRNNAGSAVSQRTLATVAYNEGRYVKKADLAAADGAKLVGFNAAESFPAGTLGAEAKEQKTKVQVLYDRIPTFEDFGATGNGIDNDGPAIRAAMAASTAVSGQPNKVYRISDNLPILIRRFHSILGIGSAPETTTDDLQPSGFKFHFTGSAAACFANYDTGTFLSHGTFEGFTVIAEANYDRIWDMRNVLGMRWIDIWMEARGNNTAGLYSTKSPSTNPSWVNWVHRCYFRLPDASTKYVFEHDWSDTTVAGSFFTGGKGVLDRGYGARYTDCQFDRSSSAGLTVKKLTDTKGGSAANCSFDANKEYGVLYDVNDDPSTNYDIGFQLVGNTFRTCDPNSEATPGLGQVAYKNNRGQVYSVPAQRSSTFLFPKNQPTETFIDGGSAMWSLRTELFGDLILGRSGNPIIDINGTLRPGATDVRVLAGNGSPEGVVDGGNSSLYHRRDGGSGTRLYIKTSSIGTLTGWSAIA